MPHLSCVLAGSALEWEVGAWVRVRQVALEVVSVTVENTFLRQLEVEAGPLITKLVTGSAITREKCLLITEEASIR